ncbi:MAG: hypothetical protein ACLTYW_00885 [Collinsella sp.]
MLDKEPCALMPLYPVPTPVSKGVIVTGTVWQHRDYRDGRRARARRHADLCGDVNALLTERASWCPT